MMIHLFHDVFGENGMFVSHMHNFSRILFLSLDPAQFTQVILNMVMTSMWEFNDSLPNNHHWKVAVKFVSVNFKEPLSSPRSLGPSKLET